MAIACGWQTVEKWHMVAQSSWLLQPHKTQSQSPYWQEGEGVKVLQLSGFQINIYTLHFIVCQPN